MTILDLADVKISHSQNGRNQTGRISSSGTQQMRRLLQIRSVIVYARGEQRDWFVISVVEISLTNKLVEKKNKRYGETTEYSTVISCKYEDKSNVVE